MGEPPPPLQRRGPGGGGVAPESHTHPPTPSLGREGELRRALSAAAGSLASITDTPRLDAELLMAHALGVSRDALLLRHLDDPVPPAFEPLIQRRLAHEPVAYIVGARAFWTIELEVGPGVLIPRPDSETLIEAAIAHFGERAPARILDLGTGPGTLLLAALDHWPVARGIGVDLSPAALAYARRNAERLGLGERARLIEGSWAEGLDERFDLVLGNPPYVATSDSLPDEVVRHEPAEALFGGADGLHAYRQIVPQLPRLLAPGGIALLEIGWTQADAVAAMVRQAGLVPRLHRDLGDRPRAIAALES